MASSFNKWYRLARRILGTIAALAYAHFIVDASIHFQDSGESTFGGAMMYALFAFFLLAYYFLWKNELISGVLLILWYGFLWILVMFVWHAAAMTIILGLPIFVLGLILTVRALIVKHSSTPAGKNN